MEMDAGEAEAPQRQQAATEAVPFDDSSSSRLGLPGAESFDGALRELKDLRSQLNEAADCCEKAFLNTHRKKLILESTKSYVCDAIVAVIDHLGTVSSKLEHEMEEKPEVTQMERKLNFLKQRLLTCEQYAMSLKLLTVRADPEAIQYHRRYISESIQRTKEENGATSSNEELSETAGPKVCTTTLKPYDDESATHKEETMTTANVDGSPRAMRRSFSLRAEDVYTALGDQYHHHPKKKKASSHGNNILSFLRKTRRHALGPKAAQDSGVEQC